MKVVSKQWRCDGCVVCVEYLRKIDTERVMLDSGMVLKEDVVPGVERGMLRWFGHLEKMNESRLTEQIYRANMCDEKVGKGRPRKSYTDHIGGILKKGQILSTRNRRACMKRFMDVGYDLVEWLMERFNLDESSNVFVWRCFQSPYYWPWQPPRVAGGPSAPTLQPDNVEYAIYLVKRTLRNKQRHGLEEYELEALANLKKNLAAKWDFINMQAEEQVTIFFSNFEYGCVRSDEWNYPQKRLSPQVRLAKDRKKGDKIVSDSQERAYWRVARPPPGMTTALEPCPVPVRVRHPRPKRRTIEQLTKEIELLKASLDRTRVKTSIALEALLAYSETFAPYDPWLTQPQPSNPWVSDDTLFWQINSPLVEVPSEKRVQRWALSIEELVSDATGLQEFTSFLRKEYSHENIRFWLAVMDLRRSAAKQIPRKLDEIYEEFLKPGAPCEINIDGATAERVAEGLRTGSRYALDHAAEHVYGLLLKKDCYPRFIRSDHFRRLLAEGKNVHQKKSRLGGRMSCGAVGKIMDRVFRRSNFFITAELHIWRSEYNCDGCTNYSAMHRWRIRLHI
ncbi:Regulator of G-protein signaling 7 [Eumeta japonica]|uniref:Regulator of G-protein signaling 7 n=1 Tax=Eumeta variegata TaxID=151549 RepID=A0A4C1VUL1_EUMVA|nr:Regulator of G-protein signaling 7 [Eumeta japonica]